LSTKVKKNEQKLTVEGERENLFWSKVFLVFGLNRGILIENKIFSISPVPIVLQNISGNLSKKLENKKRNTKNQLL